MLGSFFFFFLFIWSVRYGMDARGRVLNSFFDHSSSSSRTCIMD